MNLEQLKALRAAALQKADMLRAKVSGESRAMTDEERSEFQGYLDECDRLGTQIEQEERFLQTQTTLNRTRPDQVTNRPGAGVETHDNAEDKPFASFGEQLLAVRAVAESRGRAYDPRLRKYDLNDLHVRAAAGMSEAVASDGGFLVGQDVGSTLMKAAFESGQVASRTSKIPISGNSNSIKIPYIDETSRATGSRWGGIRAYWIDEAGSLTGTKPKFGKLELGLNKLTALAYMTDELLQDAAAAEAYVRMAVSDELSFALDDAVIRGTGAGTPLGILNAACTVSVSKETSQAAATIRYENVSKMRARMLPRSFQNAVWFINVDCQPALEGMFVPHKNVAGTENVSGQSVYIPPGGASAEPYGRLFGRPVIPIEQCETLGTVGDIILADLGMYLMTVKGGVQAASSIHVNFLTDETAFRFIVRTDGQPALKSAITPYKGSGTLSAFVTLATRS